MIVFFLFLFAAGLHYFHFPDSAQISQFFGTFNSSVLFWQQPPDFLLSIINLIPFCLGAFYKTKFWYYTIGYDWGKSTYTLQIHSDAFWVYKSPLVKYALNTLPYCNTEVTTSHSSIVPNISYCDLCFFD